ncbi:MAG TPA: leishmanolysin-related zinc metalloendopeptidase [Gemmatimonadales bacterium]|nr:leishmanolysin-related zinc metalloendopeptidase [Gemmatimonadales bacterium]
MPTEITLNSTDVTLAAVGQNLQLTASVLDQNGDPIPDAPVAWGSGDAAIVSVSGTGLLVAQGPGTAEVTATAGEATDTATVIVQSTSSLAVHEGNGQTAAAGVAVPTPPAVRVRNAADAPVSGVRVRFQAGSASGTVTGETQTTGADGIARVGSWRLGSAGVNTLTATVEGAQLAGEPVEFIATTADATGYNITLRYLSDATNPQLVAFAEAELRWESLVTGDLTDVNQTLPANSCGTNPETPGPFDDLTIFVTIEPIDGPFGILGQSGPCFIRDPGDLTVIGRMQFDSEDMELLETEGSLQAVILHEMGHVLGFGTLWDNPFGLLQDPSDPDPQPPLADTHFTGAQAIAAFDAAGGSSYTGAKVPVMNVGGAGTVNSHWRDEVFDPELMTGFLSDGFNPLSAISVRSLQDLGYTVSVADADPFTLTPAIRIAGQRRGRQLINDIISDPIRRITADGRVVGVIQR